MYNEQLTDEQIDFIEWRGEDHPLLSKKELEGHLLSDDHDFVEVEDNGKFVLQCAVGLEPIECVLLASKECFWNSPFSYDEHAEFGLYRRGTAKVATLAKHFALGLHIWEPTSQECEVCGLEPDQVSVINHLEGFRVFGSEESFV